MLPIKVVQLVSVNTTNYYLNNLIDFSDRENVEYIVITIGLEGEFTKEMRERGVPVHVFKFSTIKEKITTYYKIKKLLIVLSADIVHTHLFVPSLLGLKAAKKNKIIRITTRHHSDALYKIDSSIKRRVWVWLERYVNKTANHIIAPSQMVYDIVTIKEKVPDSKVSLIPYGQTTARFDKITDEAVSEVRQELGINIDDINLLFVSRLSNHKGHTYLFRAFSSILNKGIAATLYLVGAGSYQSILEKEVNELGIKDKVRFLGWRNDALIIMKAVDIIVHPSLEDALSSAVIEAVMLEKPIIASDISGVRDSLGNGKYGKIVPPADIKALEESIVDTIENINSARENAKKGRMYLLNYMSAQRVADEYIKTYQNLMQIKMANN